MCSLWRIIWANPSPGRRRRRHIWATVVFWPTQCCCQLRWGHVIPDINCYPRFWYAHIPDMPFIITLQLLHSWDAAFIAYFQFLAWSVPSVTLWHNSFVKRTMQCRIRWQQITILDTFLSNCMCVNMEISNIWNIVFRFCPGFPVSTVHFLVVPRPDSGDSQQRSIFPWHWPQQQGGIFCIREGGENKKLMMKNKDFCALHTMDSD